jgi:hypothetical protein
MLAILIITIVVYYFLINSAYHYWDGGQSTGPRHLTPMIPFMCLPIALVWTRARAVYKPLLVCIFFVSFTIALMSVSVSMFSQIEIKNPVFDSLIPRFFRSSGGGSNLTLIIVRNLAEPFRGLILNRKWIRQLSLIPIILIWITGYLIVASRVSKLSKESQKISLP